MKEMGCVEVGMGVESGSQKILNIINKRTTVEQYKNVIKYCHKINLSIKIFVMVGLPSENHQTIEQTKQFIIDTKPDDFDISIYTPFPRTPIWDSYFNTATNLGTNSKLDIQFKDDINYNNMFYKSFNGMYSSNVATSSLSFQEIEKARDNIESVRRII